MNEHQQTTTTTSLKLYFEEHQVRIIVDENNEPWWVAKDACEVLEIDKHRDAISRLDDDERGSVKVDTPGGLQNMAAISESGLYTLIIRSNKPQAKPFRRWVTHEVLPTIRKTGSYAIPGAMDSVQEGMMLISKEQHETNLEIIGLLRENNSLLKESMEHVKNMPRKRVNFTPDDDAQVIQLRKQGLSHREIGRAIGRKHGSICSCLRRLKEAGVYTEGNA